MASVCFEGVTKAFGNYEAVQDLNLNVEDGEFLVLLGPSGCGKTTSLRMLAGLEDVTEGQIFIGNRNVTNLSPAFRNIAMVFQSYALYPHMTIAQNLSFSLRLKKESPDEILRKVEAVAASLEIQDLLDRKPKTLSGGQQQRVALGRAIIRQPDVFLFDEPLSNLDAKLRITMREELIKLHHSLATTMVYVTHDQTEAMTMADRIVVMKNGRIRQIGTPLQIYDDPNDTFIATFVGSPAMNLVKSRVELRNSVPVGTRDESFNIRLLDGFEKFDGAEVYIGIRPESFQLNAPENLAFATSRVATVEHLGSETIVLLSLPDGGELTVKADRLADINRGDLICVGVQPENVLIFDRENGTRLRV